MIETLNSQIASDIRGNYIKYLESFSSSDPRTIAVNHFGVFSQDLINSLSTGVEEMMVSAGDHKTTIKRVFSILIEGLQNVRLHGERDELGRQLAFLFVTRNLTDYKIVFGNLIFESDREMLVNYLEKINALDKDELKKLYLDILTKGYLSKKGGAGLGFLTMRMKSENKLVYSLERVDNEKTFFVVEVVLKR